VDLEEIGVLGRVRLARNNPSSGRFRVSIHHFLLALPFRVPVACLAAAYAALAHPEEDR
jgi:hypothetical protein